jgi:hypothetical protein
MLDENGESALYASMAGGDTDSDAIDRWFQESSLYSPAYFDSEDQTIKAFAAHSSLVAPYIFRVAEAAQQLYSLATSRSERNSSNFKQQVASVVEQTAKKLMVPLKSDFSLPIAGGLIADHFIDMQVPLIIIAATSATRLLEAEVIHMQYQMEKMSGFVLAVAENQSIVGKKQFERANYYTGKTVSFSPGDLERLISNQVQHCAH